MNRDEKLKKLIKSADIMSRVIEDVMADPDQFYRYHVNVKYKDKDAGREENEIEERLLKKADTKAIHEIVSAMKKLSEIVRDLNNLPPEDAAVPDNEDTGVIIIPEVE